MTFTGLLKSLSFKQLFGLAPLFFRNPLLFYPTLKATKNTYHISNREFGEAHHKNGPANAFRHALWNFLIAQEALKWSKSPSKSISWAKRITDWHEEFSPNNPLAKAMDLHNNKIGRNLFAKKNKTGEKLPTESAVKQLIALTLNSKMITGLSELQNHNGSLVHIEDLAK